MTHDPTAIRAGRALRIVTGQISVRTLRVELYHYAADGPGRLGVKLTGASASVRAGRHGWALLWNGSRR